MSMFSRTIIVLSTVTLMGAAGNAIAFTGENLARDASITIQEARKIALSVHPGKIVDEELEHETGGSDLRYSFVIQDRKERREVGVDANTGEILENQPEGPHAD